METELKVRDLQMIDSEDSQWEEEESFWMAVVWQQNYTCTAPLSLQLPACIIQAATLGCILYDGVLAALTQNWAGEEERKRHVFTGGEKKSRSVDSL